jgi:hypothetical protein
MIIVVARNYAEAHYFLTHQDPPINPRGSGVVIVTSLHSVSRLKGLRLKEEDRVVKYGACWETQGAPYVQDALVRLMRSSNYNVNNVEYVP